MKKIMLVCAFVAFAATSLAQETQKKPSNAGFVSNKFWDNMEMSIGGGVGTVISNGKDYGKFGDRLNWEANFSLTKWFHPVWGARLQLQGGEFTNYTYNATEKIDWPYIFVHADLMINFSNWVGGYREDRAYYLVPTFGFGYMATNFTDKSQDRNGSGTNNSFAFSYGLLNKFRISRVVDFNIELKGIIAPSSSVPAPVYMGGKYMFGFSATAGFTFRFGKRDFERGVAGYTAADIQAFQDAVAAGNAAAASARAENTRLASELASAKAAADAAAADAARARAALANADKGVKYDAPTATIYFDINVSRLDARDKIRLDTVAEMIKEGPRDKVYKIEGHADQGTGTPAINRRLGESRAKNVYDYLINKGVSSSQLSYEGKGNAPDMFKDPKANRNAIIK